jgi:ribonuclease G
VGRNLLISHRSYLTRVASLADGVVKDVFFERPGERSPVGSICRGQVSRILPEINAAFLEIGSPRAGFLYAGDIHLNAAGEPQARRDVQDNGTPKPRIDILLRPRQSLLVQIIKEPLKSKGARLTTELSLAGRFLVYLPRSSPQVGISHRIENGAERERLRTLVRSMLEPGESVIIRTVARSRTEADLQCDLDFLRRLWGRIERRAATAGPAELVYEELDLCLRAVRDLLTPAHDAVLVDDLVTSERVRAFVDDFLPACRGKVRYVDESQPLFERFGVELDLARAMDRRVWLNSGGYLFIEETEALTAVDVNTGRYAPGPGAEEAILRINMEAARETAYQLRLRDIGGLIVVDFIDMETEEHRRRVTRTLKACMEEDRARSRVLPMSEFGLAEITRERVRDSLGGRLSDPCFYCKGRGVLKSAWSLAVRILSKLETVVADTDTVSVQVVAHPEVLEVVEDAFSDALAELGERSGKEIVLHPREDYHLENFHVIGQRKA